MSGVCDIAGIWEIAMNDKGRIGMQALILAAGMGRRMGAVTCGIPKPMLEVNGRSIIHHQIASCLTCGVSRFVIVTGYEGVKLREHVEQILTKERSVFVENHEYASTNTLYSLYLARQYLNIDTLYFNGDVMFEGILLNKLISNRESSILVELKEKCDSEEVKVLLDAAGNLVSIGKDLQSQQCAGEFTGIALFRSGFLPQLKRGLEAGIRAKQQNNYFEYAIDRYCCDSEIKAVFTEGNYCIEIDFPKDLQKARRLFR
jgi:choline kinase